MQPQRTDLTGSYRALSIIAMAVMVAYAIYNGLLTIFIVPFVAGPKIRDYAYPVIPLFIASICIALSFKDSHRAAMICSLTLLFGIGTFWFFIDYKPQNPLWSDLEWMVFPAVTFTLATVLRAFLNRDHVQTQSVSV